MISYEKSKIIGKEEKSNVLITEKGASVVRHSPLSIKGILYSCRSVSSRILVDMSKSPRTSCLHRCLCLWTSLSIHLCRSLSVRLSVSLSLSLYVCLSSSPSMSVCLSVSSSLSMSACLSLSPFLSMSVCLYVSLPLSLSLSLPPLCLSLFPLYLSSF